MSFLVVDAEGAVAALPTARVWVSEGLERAPFLETQAKLERIGVPGGDEADATRPFATPKFCSSRTCGPVVDVVEEAQRRIGDEDIRFIHVEVVEDNDPAKGFNRWMRSGSCRPSRGRSSSALTGESSRGSRERFRWPSSRRPSANISWRGRESTTQRPRRGRLQGLSRG